MSQSTATLPEPTLTAADRCDRCGAQAYLRAGFPGGGELLFCVHHAREHEQRLREQAVQIHDETERAADEAAAPERG